MKNSFMKSNRHHMVSKSKKNNSFILPHDKVLHIYGDNRRILLHPTVICDYKFWALELFDTLFTKKQVLI